MTKRVAILTPDRADPDFHGRWREVFDRNAEPLRTAGLAVSDRCWTEAEDLASFDLILPLLVWGYVRAFPRWLDKVAEWEAQGVHLRSQPSVLRWNADKSYLGRLAERGAPVVPSRYVEKVTQAAMSEAASAFGSERLVTKPRISHSAWQTIRWSPGDRLAEGPQGAAIIQPYLPAIESDGETSLLFFEGKFSHAIGKRPQPGDFRVQPEYDGIIAACAPTSAQLEAAGRILAAVDEELLYARIDLVTGLDGEPALIELELIEPDLYLGYAADKGAAFAAAVAKAAG